MTPGARCLQVEVRCPSKRNVRDVGEGVVFTEDTFIVHPSGKIREGDEDGQKETASVNASPRKKQKIATYVFDADLEARWTRAVAAMREDQNDDGMDDEMFRIEWTPSKGAKVNAKAQTKGKSRGGGNLDAALDTIMVNPRPTSDGTESDDVEATNWCPPPPDFSLDIPGEKVFAREVHKRGRSRPKSAAKPVKSTAKINGGSPQHIYWPAILRYYKPPIGPGEEPLYGVTFLDGDEQEITRDMFFNSDQDEFALCEVSFMLRCSLSALISYDAFLLSSYVGCDHPFALAGEMGQHLQRGTHRYGIGLRFFFICSIPSIPFEASLPS